jgi:2-(1,2-epoxy-1,2-dihydrophenyl)acetyl-CoA isomerase
MVTNDNYETIQFEIDGSGVAHVHLNRSDAANTINAQMAAELRQAALRLRWDPRVRAVLLTAGGRLFSGGGDLAEFAAVENVSAHVESITVDLHSALAMFADMDAPLVVAVGGTAGGAGMSLVAAADLVVAAARAKFTMGYTAAGLTPDGSSTYYLARSVGLRRAMELVLTNRVLSADEAREWGLVNQVVADDELDAAASKLAATLAAGPTRAYGAAKRLVISGAAATLNEAMRRESVAIGEIAKTADAREGMAAFLAKRAPEFTGR